MKQTAVEWLQEALSLTFQQEMQFEGLFQQAKEMEKTEKMRNQLFIGKIHEVLGFDKTIELLQECYKEYQI